MLNAEVCERCLNRFARKWRDDAWMNAVPILMRGVVEFPCPHCSEKLFIRIDEPPPDHCPYAVEHVVSQDAEH